jgi:hypothetical protein
VSNFNPSVLLQGDRTSHQLHGRNGCVSREVRHGIEEVFWGECSRGRLMQLESQFGSLVLCCDRHAGGVCGPVLNPSAKVIDLIGRR